MSYLISLSVLRHFLLRTVLPLVTRPPDETGRQGSNGWGNGGSGDVEGKRGGWTGRGEEPGNQ